MPSAMQRTSYTTVGSSKNTAVGRLTTGISTYFTGKLLKVLQGGVPFFCVQSQFLVDTKQELASLDSDFHDQTLGHHIVKITVDSVTLWSPAQCNIAIENPNRITGKIRDHYLYTNGLNGWITIKTPITEDCSQVKHLAIPTHSHRPLLQDPLRAAAMPLNPHPPGEALQQIQLSGTRCRWERLVQLFLDNGHTVTYSTLWIPLVI